MMELWMNSSKDGISVSAKYNAENETECNEVSKKIAECMAYWNTCNTVLSCYAGNGKRGATSDEK